jgi:hypothetical protein
MFPDVRLLIAATLASVLALVCGFGLFAAFRVSHDPLTRLPPATAALQLATDKSARLPMTFALTESFDRRFHIPAPAEPSAAAPEAAAAIGEDPQGSAAATQPQTAPPAADVAPAASSPETATAEAGHESGAAARSELAGNGEVAAAVAAIAEAPPIDPMAAPAEQKAASETAPARAEQAAVSPAPNAVDPKPDGKTADKVSGETRTWHIGAGAPPRTYRSAKVGPVDANEQNAALAAQAQKQPVRKRAAHVRSRTQESKLAPNAGTGGPFVSAPGP